MSEMTERVKSPYDTGTGYIHRQCEEREDALRAEVASLRAQLKQRDAGIRIIIAGMEAGRYTEKEFDGYHRIYQQLKISIGVAQENPQK